MSYGYQHFPAGVQDQYQRNLEGSVMQHSRSDMPEYVRLCSSNYRPISAPPDPLHSAR